MYLFLGCKRNEFACNNGKCISETQKCNQKDDCGDGSDEQECGNVWIFHNFVPCTRQYLLIGSYLKILSRNSMHLWIKSTKITNYANLNVYRWWI